MLRFGSRRTTQRGRLYLRRQCHAVGTCTQEMLLRRRQCSELACAYRVRFGSPSSVVAGYLHGFTRNLRAFTHYVCRQHRHYYAKIIARMPPVLLGLTYIANTSMRYLEIVSTSIVFSRKDCTGSHKPKMVTHANSCSCHRL